MIIIITIIIIIIIIIIITLTHWRPCGPKLAVQDYTAKDLATFSIARALP